jgi:hypothetical protein
MEQDDYRTDGWEELPELEFLIAIVTALVSIFTTGGIPGQSFFAGSFQGQKVATGRNRTKALTGQRTPKRSVTSERTLDFGRWTSSPAQ